MTVERPDLRIKQLLRQIGELPIAEQLSIFKRLGLGLPSFWGNPGPETQQIIDKYPGAGGRADHQTSGRR